MDQKFPKRFRLTSIGDPAINGSTALRYQYPVQVEIDPGGPYQRESTSVLVFISDGALAGLAEGRVSFDPAARARAAARIAQYVIDKLQEVLDASPAQRLYQFTPTDADLQILQKIDPSRVRTDEWNIVEPRPTVVMQQVFISCGQQTAEEIQLGETIARLVDAKTGLKGYFAQYQQSLEGLTNNVFNAIHQSAGFIAVMHRRDRIADTQDYRGSVWVEQELAIAAFMVQTLSRALPAKVYVQNRIRREGVRGFILLNPTTFENADEIITDLEHWLPSLRSTE